KIGHWMWFVFPQVVGLGLSGMARRYAISSLAEAVAYTEHLVLGPRLRECTQLVIDIRDRTAHEIFGDIDAMKFRSCMTLFEKTADNEIFRRALDRYYGGKPDRLTIDILRSDGTRAE